jgi:hypothetical protein
LKLDESVSQKLNKKRYKAMLKRMRKQKVPKMKKFQHTKGRSGIQLQKIMDTVSN